MEMIDFSDVGSFLMDLCLDWHFAIGILVGWAIGFITIYNWINS